MRKKDKYAFKGGIPRFKFEYGQWREGIPKQSGSNPKYTTPFTESDLDAAYHEITALDSGFMRCDELPKRTQLIEHNGYSHIVDLDTQCAVLSAKPHEMRELLDGRYDPKPYTGIVHTMLGTIDIQPTYSGGV